MTENNMSQAFITATLSFDMFQLRASAAVRVSVCTNSHWIVSHTTTHNNATSEDNKRQENLV